MANTDFLANLLADVNAPVDPARAAHDAAVAAHVAAASHVAAADRHLARIIRTFGYGRRSDEAATHLADARARLATAPHPDAR